jgi:hypothetical protein
VESAVHVLNGEPRRAAGYAANRAKAERIADGEPALLVLGGDKVRAFWANLIGSRYAVTIDTWAQRAAIGRMAEQPKGGKYARLAAAYVTAAHMVGWTPREFQAAIWLATRPQSEHAKDKIIMEANMIHTDGKPTTANGLRDRLQAPRIGTPKPQPTGFGKLTPIEEAIAEANEATRKAAEREKKA